MIPYSIERAISSGIDAARSFHKDADSPYHLQHPLFMFWFTAMSTKADCRDWSESRIRDKVLADVKPRWFV